MPSALVSIEVVVGVLVLLLVFVVVGTYLRRRYIAHGLQLTVCGLREGSGGRWRIGHIRFAENALEWYPLGGFSVRPRHRWSRESLLLDAPHRLQPDEAIAELPDAWGVPTSQGAESFELGLQSTAYTALRSWQEASPPGYNLDVA